MKDWIGSHGFRPSRRAAIAVLAALLAGVPTFAEAPDPEPSPEPEGTPIEFSAGLNAYYFYSFNRVDPLLRVFQNQNNTFTLALARVSFEKAASMDSRVGFRTDLIFGPVADIIASFEPQENGQEIYKHILQGYASFQASETFSFDLGKFVTPIGAEVTWDNWNYSRSMLFGYAIPIYHTGLRATWEASDSFSLAGFLVNGWNNGYETNRGKSLGLSATVGGESWSWVANLMTGPETAVVEEGDLVGVSDEDLTIWDTTLTWDITPLLAVQGNVDYGTWRIGGQGIKWGGFDLYARGQLRESWWLAGRYEWVDDPDGFMTIGQKAQAVTLTSDHVIAGAFRVRFEYRTDFTKDPFFPSDDGTLKTSQTTLGVGVLCRFNGQI